MTHALDTFSTAVRAWFVETFRQPTPPQAEGWLPIQRGEHTLILAPTGSGKTLAAFLWGIDEIYRELLDKGTQPVAGVRLLYVSPLKALNNDIERNLRTPLDGIAATAKRLGQELPPVKVAVRTGDTPGAARASMVKHPPHILITTPESLYLILTSPRAREMLRTVRTVIVDEIHTLCGNKRGVHLSLSLERLSCLAEHPIQRIGLSATQKPLQEVASFLGGQASVPEETHRQAIRTTKPEREHLTRYVRRPVTIVDTGYRKPLDLQVVTVVDDFHDMPGDTIWPSVIPRVLQDILQHRSTLVFCNNRRLAERTADRLNAQIEAERSEEIPPGSTEALAPGGVSRDRGIFAIGANGPIRAHHGSMSKESRHKMEDDLKAGRLPALVGTSSLELGIDIGAVDLVVQLQSPKSVAHGLQRVGRSGHVVGQPSTGRIYATFREDLAEAAAIARGMLEGDVELTYTPKIPLDVLAQQIVAMVSVEDWYVQTMYSLVRQAYSYEDLSLESFHSVLDMLSGKYFHSDTIPASINDEVTRKAAAGAASALRARLVWDKVNDRLTALPGTRYLAISNPGMIADTGAYGVYLSDGETKIGDLDEEFVFETRVGDTFLLGSHSWRVVDLAADRILVADATGVIPRMPFWNGDYPWRPYELGMRIGRFRRELAEKIVAQPAEQTCEWLCHDYALDERSARNLVAYVRQQIDAIGELSSDTTIIVEQFQDTVGEPRVVIHSPFGGRVNGAWALALSDGLQERLGVTVETQANDDGILLHFPSTNRDIPIDIIRQMTPTEARERILHGLPASAVFGAQFRMNASRALLLPKARGNKRTPFWLQRMKARNLLAMVRQFADFPIIVETYRDCLRDVMDLPHLEEVLTHIRQGEIRVVPVETIVPSPVASSLLFNFISVNMYEWDAPKAERQLQALSVKPEALEDLLKGIELRDLLKPSAIAEVVAQTQHTAAGYKARTVEELALHLDDLGDLSDDELTSRCVGDGKTWLAQLCAQKRMQQVIIPSRSGVVKRWVPAALTDEYSNAFGTADSDVALKARDAILRRFLRNSGPVTYDAILERYAFPESWLDQALTHLATYRDIVKGQFQGASASEQEAGVPAKLDQAEYIDRHTLEQIHRRTLTLLRKEIQPVDRYAYADFMVRWQHIHPRERLTGIEGVHSIIDQLTGFPLPEAVWERDALPGRIVDFDHRDLHTLCQSGEVIWVGSGKDLRHARVEFLRRGTGAAFLSSTPQLASESELDDAVTLTAPAQGLYNYLKAEGASFLAEMQTALQLRSPAINSAIAELVMLGLVTCDSYAALQQILLSSAESGLSAIPSTRPSRSMLEIELEERLRAPRSIRAQGVARAGRKSTSLSHTAYLDARRRVNQRLQSTAPSLESTQLQPGRWSLVHRAAVLGPSLSEDDRVEHWARTLLDRYGIVTRDCLAREEGSPDWSQLFSHYQRLEMRGEIRRGYFINGLQGVQFGWPAAVEKLRAANEMADDSYTIVNATDPANTYVTDMVVQNGSVESPEVTLAFSHVPSTRVVQWHGQPVLIAADNGERISTLHDVDKDILRGALLAYLERPNGYRHVVINQWNGIPVLGSAIQAWLQPLGFSRTPAGMEWWEE